MEEQRNASEAVRDLCRCWFEQRDAEKTAGYLSEGISFIGTGEREYAFGREEMVRYLHQDIEEIPEPFKISISVVCEQVLGEGVVMISQEMILSKSVYAWSLRGMFNLEKTRESWLVRSIHFSESAVSQGEAEHYPKTLVV